MIEVAPDAIDADFVPHAQPDVAVAHVGNEIVLGRIPPGSSFLQTCALNESGSIVWQCFDGSGTIAEIAADIADVFDADIDAVIADIESLARQVGSAGFLIGVQEQLLEVGGEPVGIAIGEPLPELDATDEGGRPISSDALRGRGALIVSWSPSCSFCQLIAADLDALVPELTNAGIDLVLLAIGDPRDNRESLGGTGLADRLVFQGHHGSVAFDGLGTPVAYLIDERGIVTAPLALGANEVLALAHEAVAAPGG